MCGRIKRLDGKAFSELAARLNRGPLGGDAPAYPWTDEAGVMDKVPVYTRAGLELMTWGYRRDDGAMVFNARTDNPSWRAALDAQRAVVPTGGFFEWKHVNKKATDQYLFLPPGQDVLYLAGIYIHHLENGHEERRLLVLTMPPNESVSKYHDRMPVEVPEAMVSDYLHDRRAAREILARPQPQYCASAVGSEQLSLF